MSLSSLSNPPSLGADEILAAQNWRYATKAFDPTRKLTPEQWHALEESLVLSPSSFGLQPWKFVNVVSPELRARLRPLTWNQTQVTDASHYVVFASRVDQTEADVDRFIARIAEVRGVTAESLEGYRQMMLGSVVNGPVRAIASEWAARQTYIALGNLMTAAALMGIDTCPIEGIDDHAGYDRLLGLETLGYRTLAGCALGFRSPEDAYATHPKVRYPKDEVVLTR
jgi:nitroreductase